MSERHAAGITEGQAILVADVVDAANRITGLRYAKRAPERPYVGEGHEPDGTLDSAYAAPSAVSFALRGGLMLDAPGTAESLLEFGKPGDGLLISVYVCGTARTCGVSASGGIGSRT